MEAGSCNKMNITSFFLACKYGGRKISLCFGDKDTTFSFYQFTPLHCSRLNYSLTLRFSKNLSPSYSKLLKYFLLKKFFQFSIEPDVAISSVSIERQEFNKENLREALENDKEMSQDSGDCFENLVYLQQRRRYD